MSCILQEIVNGVDDETNLNAIKNNAWEFYKYPDGSEKRGECKKYDAIGNKGDGCKRNDEDAMADNNGTFDLN